MASRFWNPNRTVWSDWESLEPFSFTVCLGWRTVPCKKSRDPHRLRSNHSVLWTITDFWVRTVSFCFSFSGEFWPIHRFEVMIRSRRNERTRRRTKIRRRSDNFRSWTKGFVRKKRSWEEEDKFLQKQKNKKKKKTKKKKGRRRTQQNRVYAQLK